MFRLHHGHSVQHPADAGRHFDFVIPAVTNRSAGRDGRRLHWTQRILHVTVLGLIFCMINRGIAEAGSAAERVTIVLQPNVTVSTFHVTLGDIADVRTTSQSAESLIKSLDVATLKDPDASTVLTRSFLMIRLSLDGWRRNEVSIVGAETVKVTFRLPSELTDIDVEAAAVKTMAVLHGVAEDELRVRLTSPFMQSVPQAIRDAADLHLEVLPPVGTRLGQTSMTVRLWDGSDFLMARPARFDVLRRYKVAVTRASLQRDQVVSERDVRFESRFLKTAADEPDPDQVIGKVIRTSIGPGTILSVGKLSKPVSKPVQQEIAVRARDRVQVTVRIGGIQVVYQRAEAMESGRPGDVIRIRNPDTKKEFAGRIVGPGIVVVQQ